MDHYTIKILSFSIYLCLVAKVSLSPSFANEGTSFGQG